MSNSRRGFISTAAGVGDFTIGTSTAARAAGPIGNTDVLVAMPGGRYYAIPPAALEQFAVNPQAFEAEEDRRAGGGAPAGAGGSQAQAKAGATRPRPPRPPASMGVRG